MSLKELSKDLINSVSTILIGEVKEASGDKEEYQKFFKSALDKFGVKSPAELEGDKEKEFYDYIDKNWKGSSEKKEELAKACWPDYEAIGMKTKDGKKVPNCVPKESVENESTIVEATYPHKMYDPNTGESVTVKNEEEHNTYSEMGWSDKKVENKDLSEEGKWAIVGIDSNGKKKSSEFLYFTSKSEAEKLLKNMKDLAKKGEFKGSAPGGGDWVKFELVHESVKVKRDSEINEALTPGKGKVEVPFDFDRILKMPIRAIESKFRIKVEIEGFNRMWEQLEGYITGEKKDVYKFQKWAGMDDEDIEYYTPQVFTEDVEESVKKNNNELEEKVVYDDIQDLGNGYTLKIKKSKNKSDSSDWYGLFKGKSLLRAFDNMKHVKDALKSHKATGKLDEDESLEEKAVSTAQQKLMAMALAYKRGEMKASEASDKVKELADNMTEKELEDFAKTKHDDLKEIEESTSIELESLFEGTSDDSVPTPALKKVVADRASTIQMNEDSGQYEALCKAFSEVVYQASHGVNTIYKIGKSKNDIGSLELKKTKAYTVE